MSDTLQRITALVLQGAADAPQRPVEAHLVEALRRISLSEDVQVVWRCHLSKELISYTGCGCADLFSDARALDNSALQAAMESAPMLVFSRNHSFDRQVILVHDQLLRISFGRRREGRLNEVFLQIRGDPDRLAPLRDVFHLEYTHLTYLFNALSALKGAQAVRTKAELTRDVQRLLSDPHPGLSEQLASGQAILSRILSELAHPWHREELLRLSEDVAEWSLHQLLGRKPIASPFERGALREYCDALARIRRNLPPQTAAREEPWGLGRRERLQLLESMLRAPLLDLTQPLCWRIDTPAPLPLLRMWTEMYELAHSIDTGRRSDDAASACWAQATAQTRRILPHLLASWGGQEWLQAPRFRNWLRLWFALQLLIPPPGEDAPDRLEPDTRLDSERWKFRADLSYVLRESLRFELYCHSSTYMLQPTAFSAALRTLVDHHARLEAQLPREQDVRRHLLEIAEVRGADSYQFAAGHLQHVLEIYLAGHFFCALELLDDGASEARTMGDVLASRSGLRPGQQARNDFLAAFSLAAIFHDVGMLLFPRYSPPTEGMCRGDRELKEALDSVGEQVIEAGRGLTERCIAELEAHECFDTISEPALARWFEEQQRCGRPDHALLSAWYLLRVAQRVESLRPEVVRAAVRATLLHSAVGQIVDPDLDPAAALLILCDELFDWEPSSHRGPSPNAVGRSLHAMAVDVQPHLSRTSALRLRGFSSRVEDGRLRLCLDLSTHTAEHCWPRFELELQHPGGTELPIFRSWLTMAQNLGRLRRSQEGWGPHVLLHARIPPRVAVATGSTHALLDRAVHHSRLPLRTRLQTWLSSQEAVVVADREHFLIAPLGRLLLWESIRPHLAALDGEAQAVLEELERRLDQG